MSISNLLTAQRKEYLNLNVESIHFGNEGVTGSSLDNYEVYTQDAIYSGCFSPTPITVPNGMTLIRIGNIVTCYLQGNVNLPANATATQHMNLNSFPARFAPTDPNNITTFYLPCFVSGNYAVCRFSVDINGDITIHAGLNFEDFASGQSSGPSGNLNFTWSIV